MIPSRFHHLHVSSLLRSSNFTSSPLRLPYPSAFSPISIRDTQSKHLDSNWGHSLFRISPLLLLSSHFLDVSVRGPPTNHRIHPTCVQHNLVGGHQPAQKDGVEEDKVRNHILLDLRHDMFHIHHYFISHYFNKLLQM